MTEGLPNAILESMLFAKPVVATEVGGVPELIDHGVEGYLVKSGDPEGFADRVVDLIRDPVRREVMGTFGRTRALSDFSIRTTVAKTTATYRAGSLEGNHKPEDRADTSQAQIEETWKNRTSQEWARLA